MWRSTEFGLIIGRGDIVTIKKEVKHAVRGRIEFGFHLGRVNVEQGLKLFTSKLINASFNYF